MVFFERKRARIFAVALIVALLAPIAVASADSYRGRRFNGAGFNGYWLGQTVKNQFPGVIPNAYQPWIQACITSGNVKLVQFGGLLNVQPTETFVKGQGLDIFTVVADPDTYVDQNAIGSMSPNKSGANNDVVPDRAEGFLDRDWYCATVTLYKNNYLGVIRDFGEFIDVGNYSKAVFAHEIGHSLKFAHPPQPPINVPGPYVPGTPGNREGEGTFRTMTFGNDDTIMRRGSSLTTLTTYDKSELREKWGR